MSLPRRKIRVVTLGCAKNTVDSEKLMGQLRLNNIKVLHDNDKGQADTVIINTCGFINDAKEESINTILQYIEAKKEKAQNENTLDQETQEWINWANDKADWIDPLINKKDEILDAE